MVVIEVISEGNIPRFERVSSSVIRIGRALDNDIIIDDLYIDPHHLELNVSESGAWQVVDLDTQNGIQIDRRTLTQANIASGDEFTIGKSRLRIFDEFHQMPTALSLRNLEHLLLNFASKPLLVGLISLVALTPCLTLYFNSIGNEISAERYLMAAFSSVVGIVFVGAFWSFLAKLLKGQFRIIITLIIAMTIISISTFLKPVISTVYYNFPGVSGVNALQTLLSAMLLGLYLYLMMTITTRLKQRIVLGISSLVALGMIAIYIVGQYSDRDQFQFYPVYDGAVYSPQFLLRSGHSTEDYLEKLTGVFAEADELAAVDEED